MESAEERDPGQALLRAEVEAARERAALAEDPVALHDLGAMLVLLCERYGEATAIGEALQVLRRAADIETRTGHGTDLAPGALGAALRSYFRITGDLAALDEAIEILSAAVSRGAAGPAEGANPQVNLAVALETRAKETGQIGDAEAAVTLLRASLAAAADDVTDQLILRSNLANALLTFYELAGGAEHADEAAAQLRVVVADFPEDDPRRASMFANLSDALRTVFDNSGEFRHITEAVDTARMAMQLAVSGDPGLPDYSNNLAVGLLSLFEVTGDAAVLTEAVNSAREAVAAGVHERAQHGLLLSTLGNCLRARYEVTGELSALDDAVSADREALVVSRPQDPNRAGFLQNLATSLTLRHEHTADQAVLREALDHARAAVAAASEGDPDGHLYLLTLGRVEYIRFFETDEREALERAIEAERAACSRVGDDHPYRPVCLANLAASLIMYNRQYSVAAALDEAIGALGEAITMTPPDSPDRALYLYNLGEARATWSAARPHGTGAAEAVAAYRDAASVETATPKLRAEAAMEWGKLAAQHGDWPTAAAGFSAAITLFPLISPRHFGRSDQEHELALFSGLGSDAAACVLASDQPDPLRAVALLEQGRGVLIGHMLGNSADLTRVHAADPSLARKFGELRDELDGLAPDRLPSRSAEPRTGAVAPSGPLDETERRREVLQGLDQVITKIRALSGLADFLREPTVDQLLGAGAAGPVVMINVSQYRCDALIIADGTVQTLPLPTVTAAGVAALTGTYLRLLDRMRQLDQPVPAQPHTDSAGMRDICSWLWEHVASPVIDHLGVAPRSSGWPRIWWCPTGSLALLPLHAAYCHDPGRGVGAGVADRVVSSYTATLRTLITLRARSATALDSARLLAVTLADTPGLPALPRVDREIGAIAAAHPKVLRNDAATRAAVSAGLAMHPWFHFAGHSYQDLFEPGQARLCLHDGGLTALAIARLRLAHGELAYLSSCEGAAAGTQVPDEPLHLTLAFQIAGYRNVIATLWPVGDRAAARVADGVYRRIARHGRIDGDQAALALHETIAGLRARYPPEMWAAYLHVGA